MLNQIIMGLLKHNVAKPATECEHSLYRRLTFFSGIIMFGDDYHLLSID
jgi:hypothetical protein